MAALSEEALKKDLSAKNPARGYLLFGDDAYLKKHYEDRLADLSAEGDPYFNLQRFGADCNLQEVYDAVMQYPMMADRKCVILSDYDFERAGKNDLDWLNTLLTELNDTCVFILRFDSVEFDLKRSSKAKKLAASMEKGGGKTVCLDHRKPAELVKMLTDGAKKRGSTFEPAAAKELVETAGNDLNLLRNELDKLCAYTGKGTITVETVREVCTKTVEASVYNLTAHIFASDPEKAIGVLDGLFFMRVEPMVIFYTVSASFVDLYRVFAARKNGGNPRDVAADFGYRGKEFVLDRAARDLRRFDERKLQAGFEALLEADRRLKSTGGDPRTVLEELTVRLCRITAKGDRV